MKQFLSKMLLLSVIHIWNKIFIKTKPTYARINTTPDFFLIMLFFCSLIVTYSLPLFLSC